MTVTPTEDDVSSPPLCTTRGSEDEGEAGREQKKSKGKPSLADIQGRWSDKAGNEWEVNDTDVRVSMRKTGKTKEYSVQEQKKGRVNLNGATLKSVGDGEVEWSSEPAQGGGKRWSSASGGGLFPTVQAPPPAPCGAAGGDTVDGVGEIVEDDGFESPTWKRDTRSRKKDKKELKKEQKGRRGGGGGGGGGGGRGKKSKWWSPYAESSDEEEDVGDVTQAPYPLSRIDEENLGWTPLRLTEEERRVHRTVCAAVGTSDYTSMVDVPGEKRDHLKHRELAKLFLSLFAATEGLPAAVQVYKEQDLAPAARLASRLFEVSRRFKMANPHKMKAEYGKLLYIVQDLAELHEELEIPPPGQVATVKGSLESWGDGAGDFLSDPRLPLATTPVPRLKDIKELNKALRRKQRVQRQLVEAYPEGEHDRLWRVLYSIDDRNCFHTENVKPLNEMLALVPTFRESGDLAIAEGEEGSRLTHLHGQQYTFVLQSLTLWRNILTAFPRLWCLMEQDMFDPDTLKAFENTGQGYNRVQQSPRLHAAVTEIVERTKQELGAWVGSDRIHLGDHQVPNGFYFIDKYSQVTSIISPILRTIDHVERLCEEDEEQAEYIANVWGSVDGLRHDILRDFFRHGFDGSGGDTDADAGSCIDGRLTSAWHWCSLLKTKPFYPAFLLSGFSSFDIPDD